MQTLTVELQHDIPSQAAMGCLIRDTLSKAGLGDVIESIEAVFPEYGLPGDPAVEGGAGKRRGGFVVGVREGAADSCLLALSGAPFRHAYITPERHLLGANPQAGLSL